ncbi:sodium:calcium antiporter [[Eubacterium] cellulosolvens]
MSSQLDVLLQVLVLLGSLLVLVKSSDLVSNAAAKIARISGLGEMAVGFLLLSVITSLPELSVSIFAVESGDVGISVGALFGSNIANLGLVLGLTALLAPSALKITQDSFRTLTLMLLVSSAVPVLALIATGMGTLAGLLLLLIFAAFCIYSIKSNVRLESEQVEASQSAVREVLLAIVGVAIVLVSAQFVVSSSVSISEFLGVEKAVVGATVVAVGTSLPELTVSLAAARRNHMNLALGNILGSCVTNLTLILGAVLVLSTPVVDVTVFMELLVMLFIVNLTVWRMLIDKEIGLGDGLILTLLYAVFMASSIGVQIVILSPDYLSTALSVTAEMLAQALAYGMIAAVAIILAVDLTKG